MYGTLELQQKGGVLTGKYGAGAAPPDSRAAHVGRTSHGRPSHIPLLTPASLAAASRLSAVAEEFGVPRVPDASTIYRTQPPEETS